jgi:hypothetical protein
MSTILERPVRDSQVVAGRAGMLAGPLFLTVVVLLTAAEWDFLHRAGWTVFGVNKVPYPSYTALGPYGSVQVANFLVSGLLVLGLVTGLGRHLTGRTGATARILLTLAALAICTSAFRTDPVPGPWSWHGTIHAISFLVVAAGSTVGILFAGLSLRRSATWRRFGTATALLAGWQVLVFTIGGGLLPGDTNFYIFLTGLFGWLFAAGRRLVQDAAAA